MHIARPPGGFNIIVTEEVKAYIAAETQDNFRVQQFWTDILDRIKITALKEGTPIPNRRLPTFTFIAEGNEIFRIPTIQIIYECFGDQLKIVNALVWKPDDQEASPY